jgi:hypothetical protein
VACGSYREDGVEHALVAIRENDGPWKLLDITADATAVVESFYPDEELEAVHAVADLYIHDMTALAEDDATG